MHRTGKELFPVRTWGAIIRRVLSYDKSSLDSQVNPVKQGTTIVGIKNTQIFAHICNTVTQIDRDSMGFGPKEVCTHSIRSSFAMMLYLQGVRSEKIMLQGRWRSSAFLTYIRAQVSEFSTGLSDKMT